MLDTYIQKENILNIDSVILLKHPCAPQKYMTEY